VLCIQIYASLLLLLLQERRHEQRAAHNHLTPGPS
jgi:hypothetical protein